MVVDRKEKLLLKMLVKFKSAFSHVYTLWGPKENLVISSTAGVHDAHFNTNGGKIIIGDRVFLVRAYPYSLEPTITINSARIE